MPGAEGSVEINIVAVLAFIGSINAACKSELYAALFLAVVAVALGAGYIAEQSVIMGMLVLVRTIASKSHEIPCASETVFPRWPITKLKTLISTLIAIKTARLLYQYRTFDELSGITLTLASTIITFIKDESDETVLLAIFSLTLISKKIGNR